MSECLAQKPAPPAPVPTRPPYGERIARHFRIGSAPTLATSLRHSEIAVTRMRYPKSSLGMSIPFPPEPAFDIAVVLSAYEYQEIWHRGQRIEGHEYARGSLQMLDYMSGHAFNMLTPFDSVRFHLPKAAMDELADRHDAGRVEAITCPPGTRDPVLAAIADALLPALCRPREAGGLFVDHLTLAAYAHVAQTYGTGRRASAKHPGRLARWREARAKEFLAARFDKDVSLSEVAGACGLSPAHFARAFKRTTGDTPHAWLRRLRIEKAQQQLLNSDMSIAQIAVGCGFADQSHLTRVFAAVVGTPPAHWRRDARGDAG